MAAHGGLPNPPLDLAIQREHAVHATGIRSKGVLGIVPQVADDILLVEEQDICTSIAWLVEAHHLIAEGSGAVGIAAAGFAVRCWPELAAAGQTARDY